MEEQTLHVKIDALRTEFKAHVYENVRAHAATRDELKLRREEDEKMRKSIFGNGQPGIGERLRVLERFATSVSRIIWILVPAVLVGSLALVWNMVLWYARSSGEG